ncbi:FAD-binding oxidoreductase [Acidisphaera sp. L21]|uniref:NAD(P)/FAD-dependent oxidoreductase n=1 Tax=Acidisphaera sp. L21 TaxID=1641851 RepID=UPI00131E8DAC|nr:FAD-binding oxidoreductase [Acidisphaera sp. L21]
MKQASVHTVAVIGGGIIGACCAIELLRDGHRVVLVEPDAPGGRHQASFGNGAWFSPSSVVPVSVPGMWKKVPGYLADPLGPLAIRWRYLPKLLPWLVRFLRAGSTVARVEATARALRPLVTDSPDRHRRLAEEAGISHLVARQGLLYVFPSLADFEAEALAWRLRRENGVEWIELDADELRQQEPSLDRRYTFGVLVEAGAHCLDPGGYVAGLVAYAETLGLRRVTANATGFRVQHGRLQAVETDGSEIAADRAVIAAGAHSAKLAAAVGDTIPLETERGYHVAISAPEVTPRRPIMPSDGKMANTVTGGALRVAGQIELAGLDAEPNWRRADILRDYALRTYPGLPRDLPPDRVTSWMGHRPSIADGLPVIGLASGCTDVVHAFGHGHIGLASGPVTGRLAADLVSGTAPCVDPAPYRPGRFQ